MSPRWGVVAAAAVLFGLGLAWAILRFNECRGFGFSVLYSIGR